MKDKNRKNEKSELEKKLDQTAKKADEYANYGRKMVKDGQEINDYVDSIRRVTHFFQPPADVELIMDGLEKIESQLDFTTENGKIVLNSPVINTTAGSVISYSTGLFDKDKAKGIVDSIIWPEAEEAINNYHSLPERITNKDEVVELMVKFGMDQTTPGKKSPLEQFITAHTAYEEPITTRNPIITSLIPLRESIKLVIDYLLKARPIQEKASNEKDKIISIGKQLTLDGIESSIIESWASIWCKKLDKELSPAKQEEISRDEWRKRLSESTLFLRNILGGLDKKKFRQSK